MDRCKLNITLCLTGICLLAFLLFSCSSQIDDNEEIYSFKECDIKFGKLTMFCDGKIEIDENNQRTNKQYKDTSIVFDSINTQSSRMIPYNFDWGVKFVKTFNNLSEIVIHINDNKTLNLQVNHTSNFSCDWQFVIWKFTILNVPYQDDNNVIVAKLNGKELEEKILYIWMLARNEDNRFNYHYKHDRESTDFVFSDSSFFEIELK